MLTLTLDKNAMLTLWKRSHGYEPARTDCTVTRTDGPDLDVMLSAEMRQWYITTLLEAPLNRLPVTEIADTVTTVASPPGAASVTLPKRCVRVAEVKMHGWERSAVIVTDKQHPDAIAQTNPFGRAGIARPVAVLGYGTLTLWPAGPALTTLKAVMLPDNDESFTVTPAMLALMPDTASCMAEILL